MCVKTDAGEPDTRSTRAGMSRRFFLASVPVFLAGCTTTGKVVQAVAPGPSPYYLAMYGPLPDERFPVPATDISKVEERFLRQQVDYHRSEPAGTIVIDTANRFLYLVQENGKALRYGIGVGKDGLAFEGKAKIGRKAEWPRWTPTRSMMERDPERYGHLGDGMEPGLTNPLGARALYLYKDGRDTLFRIHGTTEPWSIGLAVSSGCIRLFNQDIIDLYGRVPVGANVVVLQDEPLMYPQKQLPEWVARQINPQSQPQPQPPAPDELGPVQEVSAPRSGGFFRRPTVGI